MRSDICQTLEHVRYLSRTFGSGEAYYVVSLILLELGVSTKHDGYDYLLRGIIAYFENPSQQIMKELYPRVAELCPRKPDAKLVERSIRRAIGEAWKKNGSAAWIRYFSPGNHGKLEKPSNTEFISRIARVLELWKGCCEAQIGKTQREDLV